jgi:ABC-type antimicrobial peptide transport system permease subunit
VQQPVSVVIAGTLAGVAGGIWTSRLLVATIPRLPAADAVVLSYATTAIVVVTLSARYLPARRAATAAPAAVLRRE